MYVYILFKLEKMEQKMTIAREFTEHLGDKILEYKELERIENHFEVVIIATEHRPFIIFSQSMMKKYPFIRERIELAYDEGTFHILYINPENGKIEEKKEDISTELCFMTLFTGLDDSERDKMVEIWDRETKAGEKEKQNKRERLEKGYKQLKQQVEDLKNEPWVKELLGDIFDDQAGGE